MLTDARIEEYHRIVALEKDRYISAVDWVAEELGGHVRASLSPTRPG